MFSSIFYGPPSSSESPPLGFFSGTLGIPRASKKFPAGIPPNSPEEPPSSLAFPKYISRGDSSAAEKVFLFPFFPDFLVNRPYELARGPREGPPGTHVERGFNLAHFVVYSTGLLWVPLGLLKGLLKGHLKTLFIPFIIL